MSIPGKLRRKIAAGFTWTSENQPAYATAFAVFLGMMTPVIGFATSHAKGKWIVVLLITQSCTAACLFLIPYLQRRKAEKDKISFEADARIRMGDALDPLFEEIGMVAASTTSDHRLRHAERVQTSLLLSAANLIGPARSRACYFEYVSFVAGDGQQVHELRYVDAQGRSMSARQQMSYNRPDGRAMIKMIKADKTLRVDDVQTNPPDHWDASRYKGKYRSFISVPVKIRGLRPYGMLTLDSPTANALDEDDVEFLRLLGRVLAMSIAASRLEDAT